MDEGVKKIVMIGIVVVGFPLAGLIFWKYHGGGGPGAIPADMMQLVKCNNPACGTHYEVGLRDYTQHQQEHVSPTGGATTGMTCGECGRTSIFRAFRCAKCGKVALYGSVPNTFADRCPDPSCGYSEDEAKRKAAQRTSGQ